MKYKIASASLVLVFSSIVAPAIAVFGYKCKKITFRQAAIRKRRQPIELPPCNTFVSVIG